MSGTLGRCSRRSAIVNVMIWRTPGLRKFEEEDMEAGKDDAEDMEVDEDDDKIMEEGGDEDANQGDGTSQIRRGTTGLMEL